MTDPMREAFDEWWLANRERIVGSPPRYKDTTYDALAFEPYKAWVAGAKWQAALSQPRMTEDEVEARIYHAIADCPKDAPIREKTAAAARALLAKLPAQQNTAPLDGGIMQRSEASASEPQTPASGMALQNKSEGGVPAQKVDVCPYTHVEFGTYTNHISVKSPEDKWICVDACMAVELQQIWAKGVLTLECCCGHGKQPGYIAVKDESRCIMDELGYKPDPKRPHVYLAKTHAINGGVDAQA